jgi:Ni/Co efflux regulator RcnB
MHYPTAATAGEALLSTFNARDCCAARISVPRLICIKCGGRLNKDSIMSSAIRLRRTALMLLFGAALFSTPASAEKPAWAGGDKSAHGQQKNDAHKAQHADRHRQSADEYRGSNARPDREHANGGIRLNAYFGDQQRHAIRDYYGEQFRRGHCPPGLAKKHNGCMPPGQAKKWSVGHRLPPDVIFYDVPVVVIDRIGRPPAGYRYVRVASDILLIAIGSSMVIDAVEDLSSM